MIRLAFAIAASCASLRTPRLLADRRGMAGGASASYFAQIWLSSLMRLRSLPRPGRLDCHSNTMFTNQALVLNRDHGGIDLVMKVGCL